MEIQQPGVTAFTQLSDVPQTYAGAGSKAVTVNAGATGLNFTTSSGGGQSSIQFQDEGVNLGASGTVDTINFTGAGVTASRATNTLTVNVTSGGGSGTVTDASVVTANGFAGTVATSTTTPAITLTTTVTGIVKGNGTALSAAVSNTDYLPVASPVMTTPTLGVASATSINKITITQPATGSTLTIQDGFTLTVTGNVTALSGSHTGSSSGTNTGDQTNITGNAATVTVADAAGDTTTWVMLAGTQTGNQAPLTDTELTYNATTNALTATTFVGALTGNASTATSAATWTTSRSLAGNSVNGSADVPFANKFVVQGTADTGLSAAQFLGALGTGIVKNTTTTGVLSIAINSDLPAMSSTVGGAVPTPPNNTTTYLRGDGTWATVTATQPDLAQDLLSPAVDESITAGYSVMLGMRYTIASGKRLTIGLSGRMRVI